MTPTSRFITSAMLGFAALLLAAATVDAQSMYQPGLLHTEVGLRGPLDPPEQPAEEATWLVEKDVRLHHFAEGEGRSVLFIHGGPGLPPASTLPGLTRLKDDFRVHYYHQRGCGSSTRLIEKLSSPNFFHNMVKLNLNLGLNSQLADIERIRRILGQERLILVGHSFGAIFATLYAVEFPQHVEALVLVAPADMLVMPREEPGIFEFIAERLPEERQEEYAAFQQEYFDFETLFSKTDSDLAKLNARFAEYYVAASGQNAGYDENIEESAGGFMPYAIYLSLGMRFDLRPTLKRVEVPALVIHGSDDLQPEKASRAYADCLPDSRFVVMEGCTHSPFREKPEEFASIVGDFLREPRGSESERDE